MTDFENMTNEQVETGILPALFDGEFRWTKKGDLRVQVTSRSFIADGATVAKGWRSLTEREQEICEIRHSSGVTMLILALAGAGQVAAARKMLLRK